MRVKTKSPFTSIAIACAALALSGHAFALDAGPFGASLPNPALPVAAKPPGAAPAPASAQPPAGAPKPMAAASPANASIVWPSADPKGLPPAAIHGQGGECRTSFNPAGPAAPLSSCLSWTAIGKGKALFGTQWLKAGDSFPWRDGVKVAAVCAQEVVLDNGERAGFGEAFPAEAPAISTKKGKKSCR